MKRLLILFALLAVPAVYAQNTISGFVNLEKLPENHQVLLLEVNPSATGAEKVIATATIAEDGSFGFSKELFQDTDKVYQLALSNNTKTDKNVLPESLQTLKTFILSAKDRMVFNTNTTTYETSSAADKEWAKFKRFQSGQHFQQFNAEEVATYLSNTKGYIKDSLKILLVKLMSIQELDSKNLLDTDIKENPDYYEQLLGQLKGSDLKPEYYTYLESKLNQYHYQRSDTFFKTSMVLNILLVLLVVWVVFKWMSDRRRPEIETTTPLSKQETLVKNLILEGKSNKEIAAALFISVSTVKTHITNIYSKLQVSNRSELIGQYKNTTGTTTYLVPE